jgi:hypothetical protein
MTLAEIGHTAVNSDLTPIAATGIHLLIVVGIPLLILDMIFNEWSKQCAR